MEQDGASMDGPMFSDFLDDYFAECDEHLMGVRRTLLALETFIGQPEIDKAVLDDLFRHFHSLKGISGMVELRAAEDLAHRLEEYLRALRSGDATLTAEGIDVLFDGTQLSLLGSTHLTIEPDSVVISNIYTGIDDGVYLPPECLTACG